MRARTVRPAAPFSPLPFSTATLTPAGVTAGFQTGFLCCDLPGSVAAAFESSHGCFHWKMAWERLVTFRAASPSGAVYGVQPRCTLTMCDRAL